MRIAILATDNREHHRRYDIDQPYFGTAVEALLQGLRRRSELEIHIVSCSQQPMAAPAKLAANIWFHLLHVPKLGWLRTGYQGCVRAIRHKLRELRPDLVHGQGTERECALGAVFSGFPNVITIHGNMRSLARKERAKPGSYLWCAALLENIALTRTGGVFCNSVYTEAAVGARASRTWRVPNAVREEFFSLGRREMPGPSKPILLNVGAISSHKRQLLALDLAQNLYQTGLDFELRFVGAVDRRTGYGAEFLQRIDRAGKEGFARHVGEKNVLELISLLDSAVALIHLSIEESFSLVVAEALARNLKVFSVEAGGITDVAGGLEAAMLFPLADTAQLSSAVESWIKTGSPRPRPSADEMRLRYHPDVVAKQHAEIYAQLL